MSSRGNQPSSDLASSGGMQGPPGPYRPTQEPLLVESQTEGARPNGPAATARVVVLTGAGISQESGLQTFRAAEGLWQDHRISDVASLAGFEHNPTLVYRFYNSRRRELQSGPTPNAAHLALARFERELLENGGDFLLVTQNVDDLHERAGSERLVHMHGELLKVRCVDSGLVFEQLEDFDASSTCPCCGRQGRLRPHIVWFGEVPLEMDRIVEQLSRATHFISIGTSGNVYPAANFVRMAYAAGAETVELNLEPSLGSRYFNTAQYGRASELVPRYFGELLPLLLPCAELSE